MERNRKRHWSLFLGIWGLAASAPAALFVPILGLTLFRSRSSTQPDVYLDFLQADLMMGAIGAVFLIALLQTFLPIVDRSKRVFFPQFAIWLLLGAGLLFVNVVRPLPPPLRRTLGEFQISVPRTFTPISTSRYVWEEKRSYPKFEFYVCEGTAKPSYRAGCESVLISVDPDPGIGGKFPARIPEASYQDYLDANGLNTWYAVGEVIETAGGHRLIALPEQPDSTRDWAETSYLTIDAAGTPVRFANCWDQGKCFVTTQTMFGAMTYKTKSGVSQGLSARVAFEAPLIALIDNWRR
ncbi:MAG: hypothetical protein ACU0GG_10640 [Paracoccaceae bacterium]